MKLSFLPLFLLGVVFSFQTVLADGTTASAAPSSDSTNSAATTTGGTRAERLKGFLAKLDLTDAQKTQIKQIRATTTERKERRREIWAVLTPEQRTKLKALRAEHKTGAQAGVDPSNPDDI
jgi:Spy/CpxP family protein refolding chaperone